MKVNEQMLQDNRQWRSDVDAIAVVTSCMAEYMSMQTAIDKEALEARSHFELVVEKNFQKRRNFATAKVSSRVQPTIVNSNIDLQS